jgi:MoxR-like ATPase
MTLDQLLSPAVMEWLDGYNQRLEEGHSNKDFLVEFDEWFVQNEDKINKSIKSNKLNEGRFDSMFDDDEEEPSEGGDDTRKTEIVEPDTDEDEDGDEDETSEEPEEVELSADPRSRIVVDNTSSSKRNVFKVVNAIYDVICKEEKNMNRKTPLSLLDTRNVKDMTALLAFTNLPNADLSEWDVSAVKHMEGMFYKSTFNNDSICDWNVGSCADFKNMFLGSKFNQSVNKWKPKMIKVKEIVDDPDTGGRSTVEVEKRAPLPFIGANEDEEKEMSADFWNSKFKDFKYESKFSHVMDFETFMLNEGLWDKTKSFVKKGVEKVKSLFKIGITKVDEFLVAVFGENGFIPATSPFTSLNCIANGDVKGVTAYSPVVNRLLNDNVKTEAQLTGLTGYYDNIEKGDVEYENYKTFIGMINESANVGKFDEIIEEDRVGFSGKSGGLKSIRDVNTEGLKKYIKTRMFYTPGEVGNDALKPLLIWGAPGIGKSSIPDAIIKEYNKSKSSAETKKSLMVVECGDLTPDGLSLPMPVRQTMKEFADNSSVVKNFANKLGFDDDDMENKSFVRSDDAPKTWLPCYRKTNDPKERQLRNFIANGDVKEYYDDDKNLIVEESFDGGILMFDEFFRADPSIFKILMQLLLNRSYSDGRYILGDKWAIIACSNRPNDDEEVSSTFERTGSVVTTRFGMQLNFIPEFSEWRKWATTKGGFDELTLSFLVSEKDSNGEYINWHNIDTDAHAEGEVAHPTPRSWSAMMKEFKAHCKMEGCTNFTELPIETLKDIVYGAIGEVTGNKYIDYITSRADTVVNMKSVFEDPSYVIPEPIPSAAEIAEKCLTYIESHYSKTDLPPEEYLINMTNLINNTYSRSKDNYIKQMHVDILDKLMDKSNAKQLKNYFKLCDDRYQVNS